jgi:hypothetical protein
MGAQDKGNSRGVVPFDQEDMEEINHVEAQAWQHRLNLEGKVHQYFKPGVRPMKPSKSGTDTSLNNARKVNRWMAKLRKNEEKQKAYAKLAQAWLYNQVAESFSAPCGSLYLRQNMQSYKNVGHTDASIKNSRWQAMINCISVWRAQGKDGDSDAIQLFTKELSLVVVRLFIGTQNRLVALHSALV